MHVDVQYVYVDNIRAHLLSRGVRQNWLAAEIGMNATLLNHILAGRRKPPVGFYTKVARALRVRLSAVKPTELATVEAKEEQTAA